MHPPPRQLKRACKIRLEAQTSSNEPSPENHYGLESSRVRLWIYPPIPYPSTRYRVHVQREGGVEDGAREYNSVVVKSYVLLQ